VDVGALLAHLALGLADRDALEIGGHEEGRDAASALLSGLVRAINVKAPALPALVM
jgi:hypothetical protein